MTGRHRAPPRGRAAAVGTLRTAFLVWRTGRAGFLLAPLAVAGLVAAVMASVTDLYGTRPDRATYAATLGRSPATAAFNGRPFDLDRIGGIAVYEVGFFGLLFLPAVAILLAVRHSRGQEDLGRADLITSTRIGRLAPLLGAMTVTAASLVAAGMVLLPAVLAAGYDRAGSVRYVTVLVLFMLAAMGLGFCAAEVSQTARSAYGLAFGVQGAVYLVRAVIDGRSWDLGWLTPMGWVAEARPYADDPPWWPPAAMLATAVALSAFAVLVRARRDLGAGLVAPRRGPAVGTVRGPVALAWRVSRGAAAGWAAGALTWGIAIGLLAEEMRRLLTGNPVLTEALLGTADTPDAIMTYIAAVLIALMAACLAVQGVTRMAAEESAGRIGVVLSARLTRLRWWSSAVLVVGLEALATLALGGIGFGAGAALTGSVAESVREGIAAPLAYAPPVLLIGALGFLLLAVSHRLAALAWLLVLWAALVALLADTLQLAGWARELSPVERLGDVPIVEVDLTTWLTMVAIAAGAVVLALGLLSRRDLAAG